MKKLLILTLLLLAMCSQISDKAPLNCYCTTLQVSATSGEVLTTETISDFVYETESIEKWLHDEGVTVIRDTVNKLITIKMVACVEVDKKGM